ncbi:MAG TPA: hypothetical protein VFV87_13190 [Pirellulaceae bacterium]|nr:hypothetical protein [Pirellulaceae bacterium]
MVAHEGTHRFRETLQRRIRHPEAMIENYPISTMLFAFGLGMGLGIVIVQACGPTLMNLAYQEPSTSEKLSRQIYEAVSSVLPESISRRMHS